MLPENHYGETSKSGEDRRKEASGGLRHGALLHHEIMYSAESGSPHEQTRRLVGLVGGFRVWRAWSRGPDGSCVTSIAGPHGGA
jgi:hypothetical protein